MNFEQVSHRSFFKLARPDDRIGSDPTNVFMRVESTMDSIGQKINAVSLKTAKLKGFPNDEEVVEVSQFEALTVLSMNRSSGLLHPFSNEVEITLRRHEKISA